MVRTSRHIRFYEGTNYIEALTPNTKQLMIYLSIEIPTDKYEATNLFINFTGAQVIPLS